MSNENPNLKRKQSLTSECVTDVSTIILTQRWTISNFDNILKFSKPGDVMRSSVFKDDNLPEVCWQLCLYPGGKRVENAGFVSLFLKMSSRIPAEEHIVKAEYRFYFLDDDEQPIFANVNVGEFHAKPPKGGHSWGLRNIPMDKVMKSIREDKSLVLSCVIEVMPSLENVKPSKKVAILPAEPAPVDFHPTSPDSLPDDFKNIAIDNDSPIYDEEFDAELVE